MSKQIRPLAEALRAAGFVPLPRLWVHRDDMPAIHEITARSAETVNNLRQAFNPKTGQLDPKIQNAKDDRDAAWALIEQQIQQQRMD